MSHDPSVLSVASRALVDACRALGVEVDGTLERLGLSREVLENPESRLPASLSDALWRELSLESGDPQLALHAAEGVRSGAYRVLDYLATSAPTLGEGLQRVVSYFALVDSRGRFELEEEAHEVALRFLRSDGVQLPPPAQEYTFAVILARVRDATAAAVRPAQVCFSFPRPRDSSEHQRIFGVAPRFEASAASMSFSRADWERTTRGKDASLFAILDEHARLQLERASTAAPSDLADGVVARAREVIAQKLEGEPPTLAEIAKALASSTRSLQRRLEAAGTSFAQLVDDVRHERARAFLGAPDVSLSEVSWLLGFSEQSAFTRAFKRWTGLSPTRFRAELGSRRSPP